MEISPPETFVAFLQAILEAEIKADLWKSKLFYFAPEEIVRMFETDELEPSNVGQPLAQKKSTISVEKIMNFLNKNLEQQQTQLFQERQKIICKYFGFSKSSNSPKETFLKRLKPTNNKLILTIQKQNLNLQQSLIGLFSSIIQGYAKIKQKREECANNIRPILSYFQNRMGFYKGLSNEILKEITFEANMYGRINFSYLKDYVFGNEQDVIGWETLFGVKIDEQIEKIQQLSEQNIVSDHAISYSRSRLYENTKKEAQQCPSASTLKEKSSVYLQSVSQINTASESFSISKIHPVNQDYSNVLNQIDQIEKLLNKTKQRYQKNREELQNETHNIKSQHLNRSQNLGKFSSPSSQKISQKYQNLKIYEIREQISSKIDKNQILLKSEVKPVEGWQDQNSMKKTEKNSNSPYKTLKLTRTTEETRVQSSITRQQMRKQIEETMQQSNFSRISGQSTQRRQAGKIKRRSLSKDVEKPDQNKSQKTSFNSNYSEYEAVLQEIKREETMYKRMVQDREKILYQRKMEKRLDLGSSSTLNRKNPSVSSLINEHSVTQPSPHSDKKLYTLPKSPSQNRYEDIMKEIETNIFSRSRVSSKKREEIVQKATSEARLRIQQIQNRALKRLAKLDTDVHDKSHPKQSTYLKLQPTETEKSEIAKCKPMKENTNGIKPPKSHHSAKFFMNDLFNQRPNLKLSTGTSIYKAKY